MRRIIKFKVDICQSFMLENVAAVVSFDYKDGGLYVWVEEDLEPEDKEYFPTCYLVVPTGVAYEPYYRPVGSCITPHNLVFHLLRDKRPVH